MSNALITRRLFVVLLGNNEHGKTTITTSLINNGLGGPPTGRQGKYRKGTYSLFSPWGRPVEACIFVRSFQEREEKHHERPRDALDAICSKWRELDLVVFPLHPTPEGQQAALGDARDMIEAGQEAGFDVVCASIIHLDRDWKSGRHIWSLAWDERWTLFNPEAERWEQQVTRLGTMLWTRICQTMHAR